MKKILLAVFASALIWAAPSMAQTSLRANVIGWGAGIANLGVETNLTRKLTLVVDGFYSPSWHTTDFKLDGFVISPELRYYFCMAQRAHYIGLSGNYANYNEFQPTSKRNIRDGYAMSIGLTYGYTWYISRHWNFDLFAGVGWWHSKNDIYCRYQRDCVVSRDLVEDTFNITRIGANFCYKF